MTKQTYTTKPIKQTLIGTILLTIGILLLILYPTLGMIIIILSIIVGNTTKHYETTKEDIKK